MINVYEPYLNESNLEHAHKALDSTWISSRGEYITEVESILSNYYSVDDFNRGKALLTSNGTTALHLCARLLDKAYPKIKKIIVPNNVYVAAWNAFLFDKKYELEAIDADIDTWNVDLDALYSKLSSEDLEETALLVVHNIGNIVNVPKIKRDFPNLVIIEDNCEGFFGEYEGMPSGSASFTSAISFFGNKNITSGEGGAIIASERYHDYLFSLRGQGQSSTRFIHDELGYNYRITNVQAAILYGQFDDMTIIKSLKNKVFDQYKKNLKHIVDYGDLKLQTIDPDTKHSQWMFGVRIPNNKSYIDIEKYFKSNHIEVRPMFYPINQHAHLKNIKCNSSSVAKQLNNECVILPSYPTLKDHEICHITNTLKAYILAK